MVPFRPPISAGSPGGSTIVDRIVQAVRKSFDSLKGAFVGRPDTGLPGQVLILGPDSRPLWAGYTASSVDERSIQELVPSVQEVTSLPTATSTVKTIPLTASRHYWITAIATAFAANEAVVFTSTLFIRMTLNLASVATHLTPDTTLHTSGAGFSFTAATSGSDLQLTVSNTSGSTRTVQLLVSFSSARTRT